LILGLARDTHLVRPQLRAFEMMDKKLDGIIKPLILF
jgi:hypothetical protein